MKLNFLLIVCVCLFFTQCSLNFSGNTFLTIDGTITDSVNIPIENVNVVIRNKGTSFEEYVNSASTSTDSEGKYRLTFPISNGSTEIGVLGKPYSTESILNSFEDISYGENPNFTNWFFVKIDTNSSFVDYYYKADNIKIK